MNIDWFRDHCLSFPHSTEQVQWGNNLVFKVGDKMFAIASLEPDKTVFAFKCTPERYAELIEVPGIIPAPYLARAQWVGFERSDALPRSEVKALARESYDTVVAKLPKKTQRELGL